jgi:proline-specific peptidase
VLGHSSGGWIALEAMLRDMTTRSRVAKLVLASAPLDVPAFIEAQTGLIASLGVGAHRRLRRNPPPTRGRAAAAYNRDYERFLHTFICRPPWPPELVEAMSQSNRDLYEALWGPSEVCVTGELRNWSCTDRAECLDMPILLTSGRHDEVTPVLMQDALALLPTASWHLFDNSAHMPHLEEPGQYLDILDTFL